jgi:hypothetical protein
MCARESNIRYPFRQLVGLLLGSLGCHPLCKQPPSEALYRLHAGTALLTSIHPAINATKNMNGGTVQEPILGSH